MKCLAKMRFKTIPGIVILKKCWKPGAETFKGDQYELTEKKKKLPSFQKKSKLRVYWAMSIRAMITVWS
jgi:hypothetical protein